jgi:Zn-finger nucleic acid-binding protein
VRCPFCTSRLATVSCPHCFKLLFRGADFCSHCGAQQGRRPEGEAPERCPRCHEHLIVVSVGATELLECATCDGIWVEAGAFEQICRDGEAQAAVLHRGPRVSPADVPAPRTRRMYRPCPRCRKLMNRVNFGRLSGIVLDVCRGHGTFFDRGELHGVVRFIQSGGLARARLRELEDLKEEQRRLESLRREQARHVLQDGTSPGWDTNALLHLLSLMHD